MQWYCFFPVLLSIYIFFSDPCPEIPSEKNYRQVKTKKLAALVYAVSPLVIESVISFSECYWAVTHATRSAEGSQGCREDADDDLQDSLPSFFLHGAFMVFLG